ncbi:hypothetical protein [Isoptericola sp. S6320L]|nr:hypothetical protein [Isoptericola sp. S6320L]
MKNAKRLFLALLALLAIAAILALGWWILDIFARMWFRAAP